MDAAEKAAMSTGMPEPFHFEVKTHLKSFLVAHMSFHNRLSMFIPWPTRMQQGEVLALALAQRCPKICLELALYMACA